MTADTDWKNRWLEGYKLTDAVYLLACRCSNAAQMFKTKTAATKFKRECGHHCESCGWRLRIFRFKRDGRAG